jgi:RNA polymerase sigma-70 factor (ECF subfamily)
VSTPEQEAFWILRAQYGDRDALERLLESAQAPLGRYIRGLVGSDAAEDVWQNVLLQIFRRLSSLEDPALFRAWAFRIASRAAFRWLKRQRRWRDHIVDAATLEESPATVPAIGGELLPALERLDLSPASRAVLLLHFQHDLPLADVAAILAIPIGTAKSRLAYGLRRLRQHLGIDRRS